MRSICSSLSRVASWRYCRTPSTVARGGSFRSGAHNRAGRSRMLWAVSAADRPGSSATGQVESAWSNHPAPSLRHSDGLHMPPRESPCRANPHTANMANSPVKSPTTGQYLKPTQTAAPSNQFNRNLSAASADNNLGRSDGETTCTRPSVKPYQSNRFLI